MSPVGASGAPGRARPEGARGERGCGGGRREQASASNADHVNRHDATRHAVTLTAAVVALRDCFTHTLTLPPHRLAYHSPTHLLIKNMLSMAAPHASLDTLPSELIWEILQYCYCHERTNHIPKRYSTLNSIVLVNKRLREYGLRLLLREIKLPKCEDFLKKVEQFREHLAHRTCDVRCVVSPP